MTWVTPIAEYSAGKLSLLVLMTKVCHGWDSNTQPPKRSYAPRHHCGGVFIYQILVFSSPKLKANVSISDEPKYPYV